MSLALQIALTGLAAGSVYGLMAIGHTLVFRLTGIVHFALGDLAGLGVFVALLITVGRGPVTTLTAPGGRFAVGLVVALALVSALASAGYFAVIHPYLVRGSTVGWVAATTALAFAIQSAVALVFDRPAYVFPDLFPFHRLGDDGIARVGGATLQVRALFVIAVGVILALGVSYATTKTRFGRGLEAIAMDTEGARVVGVPVERFIGLAFGLVGGVAALIAIVAAPSGSFSVHSGLLLGLKGLLAALVVSFAAPGRAFVAGLGLGVVEAAIANGELFGWSLGPAYREVVPLGLVFSLLLLRRRRTMVAAA
jgi:branched-chain amino acid transport system permease protein